MAPVRSFLVQWESEGLESKVGTLPTHSVGSHMKGIVKGDQIFLTVCDGKELYLLGAMAVTKVGLFGKWKNAKKPKVGGKSLAGPIMKVPLGGIKWQLEFGSQIAPKLSRSKSLLWQVRARRRLTPASAEVLLRVLQSAKGKGKKTLQSALEEIKPNLPEIQLHLLEAHYLAPDHTATAEELAVAAGFSDSKVTNLHYGKLGRKLRRILARPALKGQSQSGILASFDKPDKSKGFDYWRWVMRSELVEAINALGWFIDHDLSVPKGDALEGTIRRRLTNHRSREASLRRAKLAESRRAHPLGRLVCEVPNCGFDFEAVYDSLGEGYAEVHHLRPLSELDKPMTTRLIDLAVVCSNCHRMIHRGGDCRRLDAILPADSQKWKKASAAC